MPLRQSTAGAGRTHYCLLLVALSCLTAPRNPTAQAAACELCETGLTFANPEAGKAVPMTVQLRFAHQFLQGDTVVLRLPEFSRAAGSTTSFASAEAVDDMGVPSPAFTAASWNEAETLLTLHHINPLRIVAGTLLRVTVPNDDALIRLPSSGSVTNRTDVLIKAVGAGGTDYTSFEQIMYTEPVGVLYNSSVAFEPALPLTPVSVSLNFTTSIRIDSGETATLLLPGFNLTNGSAVHSTTCPMRICSNMWDLSRSCSDGQMSVLVAVIASGQGTDVLLTFVFSEVLDDLDFVSVTLPQSAGIITPASSVLNNHFLLLGSQSSAGPVLPSAVEVSNEIPSHSIAFRPAKAATGECARRDLGTGKCTAWVNERIDIDVNLVLQRNAVAGDEIWLSLPGFTRKEARQEQKKNINYDANFTLSGSSSAAVPSARWNESAESLLLLFSASLPAGSLVSVTVLANSSGGGLLTSPDGTNPSKLKWSHKTPSVDPGQSNFQALASLAVGAFSTTSLYYEQVPQNAYTQAGGLPVYGEFFFAVPYPLLTSQCIAYCGTAASAATSQPFPFSVNRELFGPVTVSLLLAGFSRAGGNLDHFEIHGNALAKTKGTHAIAHASWVESSSTLVLTVTADIQQWQLVTVSLPADIGISLPTSGLTWNDVQLRASSNSMKGTILSTSIAQTTAIGVISKATVSFSPAKAGVPVTLKFTFSFSQDLDARESFEATLPGFSRTRGLPSALDSKSIECTVNGVVTPMWVYWKTQTGVKKNEDFPILEMMVGAGGIQKDATIEVVVKQENEIYFREAGTPRIQPRSYWRIVNNSAVKSGWSVADLVFYSDPACTIRIPTKNPLNVIGSSGQDQTASMNCTSFRWHSIYNETWGCPQDYRRALFSEIASCKLALCDVKAWPEFLVGQGDGAYFLGAAYGCQVHYGATSLANTDSLCVPRESAARNALDHESSSVWSHFVDTSCSSKVGSAGSKHNQSHPPGCASEIYVGTKFASKVAVQCASVEQERFRQDWSVHSFALQSSPDGIDWATIMKTSAVKGVNLLWRPEGASGSNGFDSITLSTSAKRGPCKNVRVSALAVGSFGASSSLTFGTPVAGLATNITLKVTPEMEIDAGETITLTLSGFTGNASSSLALIARFHQPTFNGSSYVFVERVSYNPVSAAPPDQACTNCSVKQTKKVPLFNATWDPGATALVITCGAVIYAGQTLTVTVLESNDLRLPAKGIAPSACGTGPTVGPLSQTSGNGTSRSCGTCEGCIGINENTISIACNARAGPVLSLPPTIVRNVQRVGSFFNTSIAFSALTDMYAVNVSVQFTYDKVLLHRDKVFVHLPAFTSFYNKRQKAIHTRGANSSVFSNALWDPDTKLLVLTLNSTVPALSALHVTIPDTAGVVLRSHGFVKNSPDFKMSTNAVNGPVFPTIIADSPAMGSFTTGEPTRLSYAEFQADGATYMEGRASSLTISFALNRQILIGESVFLQLTGFSRDTGDSHSDLNVTGLNSSALDANIIRTVDTTGVFSTFTVASWSEIDQRLTFTAAKESMANLRHSIFIPSSAGLRLPRIGLRQNDDRLRIGTNASHGPNSGTPIDQSPALAAVCGAECGAWAFTCGACRCGPCAPDST